MITAGSVLMATTGVQEVQTRVGEGGAGEPGGFLAILGVLLFFGLLVPRLLRRLHLPFATSLILVGSIMGPYGLELVAPDPGLALFGFLGATFHDLRGH